MRRLAGAAAAPLVMALLLGAPASQPLSALASADGPGGTQTVPPTSVRPPAPQPPPSSAGRIPTMAELGQPSFPDAQFLVAYSAGRGQQFYLFGTTASFTEVIAFYKVALKQKGELVFDDPGVYVFEVGKFTEDTMAFPPGITIKDYSTGRLLKGYLNPKPGARPAQFPTVIQIVTPPPAAANAPKR